MERSTVFAGFGGQGLLFAGQVLARAAMAEGREVLWIPSYGPEMRGGTASCTVIVGDEPIGSPVVDLADAAVVLNPPSLARFEPLVAPGGLLVVNTSLIEAEPTRTDIEVLPIACTAVAREAGALVARRSWVSPAAVREAMAEQLGEERARMLAADLAAFEAGMRAAAEAPVTAR